MRSYFDRDVTGVRQMFKRKFGYESSDYPTFEQLQRDDDLDVEVSCSGYGFSKDEEQDLLHEYHGGASDDGESDDDDNEDDKDDVSVADAETEATAADYTEAELAALRQQVDQEVQLTTAKPPAAPAKDTQRYDSIASYIQSMSVVAGDALAPPPIDDEDTFEDAHDVDVVPQLAQIPPPKPARTFEHTHTATTNVTDANADAASDCGSGVSSTDLGEVADAVADLDPNSRAYRIHMVKQMLSDARSQRSYSTTASTIAPELIKGRVRRTIEQKEQREVRKRCLAKGEASVTNRGRKENKDTVKEYAGWDF